MAEPVSHIAIATTVAVAAPSIAVLFAIWPFGIAFVAGCVYLIYSEIMAPKMAIRSVIGSVFIGGGFSQVLAQPALHICATINDGLAAWSKEQDAKLIMIAFLAMFLGLIAQAVIPYFLKWAGPKIGGL
jgi:hypothetical protein